MLEGGLGLDEGGTISLACRLSRRLSHIAIPSISYPLYAVLILYCTKTKSVVGWGARPRLVSTSCARDRIPPNGYFLLEDPRSPDRALFVPGSNMAEQGTLTALLDTSTHSRAPLTQTSHHQPTLADFSRFRVSLILTNSRFRRSNTCISGVSAVSLVGVSL